MSNKNSSRIVSIDAGNGWTKARSSTHDFSFPSIVAIENESVAFSPTFSPNGDFIIAFEGKNYAIGQTVYSKGLLPVTIAHRSRVEQDFYRVIFASALAAVVRNTAEIQAVVSLPPGAYFDRDKYRKLLAGEYTVSLHNGKNLTYSLPAENLRIIPEGVGTICNIVLDENGRTLDNTLFRKSVGVVDVGTYTTDLLFFDQLKLIQSGTTSLPRTGVTTVHNRIKTLASRHGVDIPDHKLDRALTDRYFLKDGKRIDISEDIETTCHDELAEAIGGYIRQYWNGGDDAEYIVLTGGGSPLVYYHLQKMFGDRVLIVEDAPHFANCEGGYRYGLLHQNAGK